MLSLSKNNVSLGRIKIGVPVTMYVSISNSEDADVQITSISPGCGKCTKASVDSYTIPAKGSVNMSVVFTPDSTSQVAVTKSVTINKSLVFSFNATVTN